MRGQVGGIDIKQARFFCQHAAAYGVLGCLVGAGMCIEDRSITRRPTSLLGGYVIRGRRMRAARVTGGVLGTRSRVRVRRREVSNSSTGSLGSMKDVCGVLWAIGTVPSMLASNNIPYVCIGLRVRCRSRSVIDDAKSRMR
mgnify:CR=1 FL=1